MTTNSSSLEEKDAVDQPAGDADRLRDLLDRRVLHPALVEQRTGRRDELPLAAAPDVRRGGGHGADPTGENVCQRNVLGLATVRRLAERGAQPQVPALQRRALRALRSLFTPLLPDDYLELINPLWSTQELRGRIESIRRETAGRGDRDHPSGLGMAGPRAGAVPAHRPRHRRDPPLARLLAHLRPGRPDGYISITPKLVDSGKVSPYLVREARPGTLVRLGGVEGAFTFPSGCPTRCCSSRRGAGSRR